jgi:hypothetical protein
MLETSKSTSSSLVYFLFWWLSSKHGNANGKNTRAMVTNLAKLA